MSPQPQRPGEIEEIDDEMKRVLDHHIEAADKDPERISREEWRRSWQPEAEPQSKGMARL